MEAILHIGTPKTGTTSIQKFLAGNEALLAEHGVLYPVTGREVGKQRRQRGLVLSVLPVDRAGAGFDKVLNLKTTADRERYRQSFLESFEAEMKSAAPDRVVISDEALYLFLSTEALVGTLKAFLSRHFDRVRIVAYVRAPTSFVESSYSTHLKMGGTRDLADFAAHQRQALSYWTKLSLWRDVFGADAITVREFSRPLLHREDVVLDFLHAILGIDIALSDASGGKSANTSIAPLGQHLLLAVNRRYAEAGEARPGFYRRFVSRKFKGSGQRLTADEAARLTASLRDEIDRLSADFFGGRTIFEAPVVPAVRSETPAASELVAAAIEMSAAALKDGKKRKGSRRGQAGRLPRSGS